MTGPSNPLFTFASYNGFFITIEHDTLDTPAEGGITGILPVLGCLLLTK